MDNTFESLGLRPELVQAVTERGYEQATPIQAGAIPALLEGHDVLGQAQTGTGKTAAFALPMLQNLDLSLPGVQGLILAPTRELAVQVSETIYRYGMHLNVRVLPIYGGAPISRQLRKLQEGVNIVVGTPGRVLDMINRGALKLNNVRYLVLDEADEMLKMGFIDDVETILKETPEDRQTALFSATLSPEIRRLSSNYMHDPVAVTIQNKSLTVTNTEQKYYLVYEEAKFSALSRLLEIEEFTSILIFARTRVGASELAESLLARGYPAESIHGDLSQELRETVLRRFRNGRLSILVATDVVARGMDIQGVSHVINYDIPFDPEDYVHRIGRTGRAGRPGVAITLITPREKRRLKMVEEFTRQNITRAKLPTVEDVLARREQRFQAQINTVMLEENLESELAFVRNLETAGYDMVELAAAAIHMARAFEQNRPVEPIRDVEDRSDRYRERSGERSGGRFEQRDERSRFRGTGSSGRRDGASPTTAEAGMVRLMLNVGREDGIRPGDVVGAIASEAGIPGRAIGAIEIGKRHTFVDVKEGHVDNVLRRMARGTLRGKPITLKRAANEN